MPRNTRAPRNPLACSPLLRKGGIHTQSKTGQRTRAKLNVEDEINEWRDEQAFITKLETHQSDSDESFLCIAEYKVTLFQFQSSFSQ